MIDQRTFEQIKADFLMPWRFITAPGMQNGMARIVCLDLSGKEVPLTVLMRIIDIVSNKAATQ